jgi:hypothetical protein
MVYFQNMPPVLVHFGRPLNGNFIIFYEHLVCFVAICLFFWQFGIFCVYCINTILVYWYIVSRYQEEAGNPAAGLPDGLFSNQKSQFG